MTVPRHAPPVLFIIAATTSPSATDDEIVRTLTDRWGAIEVESEPCDFDAFTGYYADEMGLGLTKRLVVFRDPVNPSALADLKNATNDFERRWADASGNRRVNLDPGYLTPLSFVLASAKPSGYRIYLRDGIYAEITLRYEHGEYVPVPWTYPDYRLPSVRGFFSRMRPKAVEFSHREPIP